jgi:hypothetical protein
MGVSTDDLLQHSFLGTPNNSFAPYSYLRFNRWLDELALLAGEPQAVYFEEVRRHAGVDAAHAYG